MKEAQEMKRVTLAVLIGAALWGAGYFTGLSYKRSHARPPFDAAFDCAALYTLRHQNMPSMAFREAAFRHLNDKVTPSEEQLEVEGQRDALAFWVKAKPGPITTNNGVVYVGKDPLFNLSPTTREQIAEFAGIAELRTRVEKLETFEKIHWDRFKAVDDRIGAVNQKADISLKTLYPAEWQDAQKLLWSITNKYK